VTDAPDRPPTGVATPEQRGVPGWVGWAVFAVLAAAVVGFLLWGADRPVDPYLVDTAPASSTVASPSGRTSPVEGLAETGATITTPDGRSIELCLLVAESREERAQGLMGVTDLGGYDGMLFRFPTDTTSGFWMKDTPMPLTIAYYDASGAFVSSADMAPCPDDDCPVHEPAGPFRSAVEVPSDRFAELGIAEGTVLVTGLGCPPPD
jgi:hypothetical protein